MNAKTIKLYKGPHDGEVIVVPYTQVEWQTTDRFPAEQDKQGVWHDSVVTVYRETNHAAASGEVIFSCYESLLMG